MLNEDTFTKVWLSHRTVLHSLLEIVNEEQIHYKPWEGAMSFGEQALHIAKATDMFVRLALTGEVKRPDAPAAIETIEELKLTVQRYTNQTKADLETITSEQLESQREFGKVQAPGSFWLEKAKDHEIHHKGQLFIYARLLGIKKLPFFVGR